MKTRLCKWNKCKQPFVPRQGSGGKPQKFCCKSHGIAARVERDTERRAARRARAKSLKCLACGITIVRKVLSRKQRFCSDRCRERVRKRDPQSRALIVARYTKKMWTTPEGRLRSLLRNRLFYALKDRRKNGSAVRDLGCSLEELKRHLEAQFLPGMTWDNWGPRGWHVDHIKPLALFDLTDPVQFKEACHYTNLRPLWAFDNCSQGTDVRKEVSRRRKTPATV